MAEEQNAILDYNAIRAQVIQGTTFEAQRAATIAAMGGAQSKRAREYVALLDALNERLARK